MCYQWPARDQNISRIRLLESRILLALTRRLRPAPAAKLARTFLTVSCPCTRCLDPCRSAGRSPLSASLNFMLYCILFFDVSLLLSPRMQAVAGPPSCRGPRVCGGRGQCPGTHSAYIPSHCTLLPAVLVGYRLHCPQDVHNI